MNEPKLEGTANVRPDAERYLRMAVPFESKEAFDDASRQFFEDVGAARERNKITEVLLVHMSHYKDDNGQAKPGIASFSYGDSGLRSTLAGWLYEQESAFFRHLMSGVYNRSLG